MVSGPAAAAAASAAAAAASAAASAAAAAAAAGAPAVTVSVAADAVPYLIGIGGRNVKLIGRHTGSRLWVHADTATVEIAPRGGGGFDPELAQRFVRSVCEGGVLKWFSSARAARTQYPEEAREGLVRLALEEFGCALRLLRAATGHTCLVLVGLPDARGGGVRAGRVAVLDRLRALSESREAAAAAAA